MFKNDVIFYILILLNGVLSVAYTKKFLKEKTRRNVVWILWAAIYLFLQIIIDTFISNEVGAIFLQIICFIALEYIFFYWNWSKGIFVAFSFIAGKEIIKYIISVVSIYFYELLSLVLLKITESGAINDINKANQIFAVSNQIILCVCGMLSIGMLFVYLKILARKFIWKDYKLTLYQNAFLILPCVAALCIAITMKKMVIILEYDSTIMIYDKVPETKFWIPFICMLLLGTIITSVILFQKMVQCTEEEKRRSLLENQVIQLHRETKEIQDIYGDMRGLKHDLNSHLNNIMSFVKNRLGTEETELLEYIDKMEQTVGKLDFTYKTGNAITDIIIHQKKQEAGKEKIDFIVDFFFPENIEIDVYDISIILNNGLENAIEACKKVEGGSIYLKSYIKKNLFFVEIQNDYIGEIVMNKESGLPLSSKADRNSHGVGLQNVKRCAQKYNGDIDISVCDENGRKSFMLVAMMCGNISHHK